MKTILILILALATTLLSGCWPFDDKQKDEEIAQLRIALIAQRAAREADLAFAERQAAMYLGCKQFFDLCSKEIRELGQQRLKEGFTGTTSAWYWLGLLGVAICIAVAIGVIFATLRYLHLIFITPKKEQIDRDQRLIDTADERVHSANARAHAVNLRTNILEQKTGSMKKELARLYADYRLLKKPCPVAEKTNSNPTSPSIKKSVKQVEQDY